MSSDPGTWLSLVRAGNLALGAVGVAAAAWIAGAPASSAGSITIAAGSAVLLGAAGNVINDILDVGIDRINKPRRAIASGTVNARQAWTLFTACTIGGMLLAALLPATGTTIAAAGLAIMTAYSLWLKRVPLVGNLAVAVTTGLAMLLGASVAGNTAGGLVPAGFALLVNLAREVLKDVEDMPGDAACGVRTFPIVKGVRAAYGVVIMMLLVTIAATPVPWFLHLYTDAYLAMVLVTDLALLGIVVALWRRPAPASIPRLHVLIKLAMPIGITAMCLGRVTP